MLSRFVIAVTVASISLIGNSSAQQITSQVPVLGAALNDGYGGGTMCGAGGLVYRYPNGGVRSVMRVAPDGSKLVFTPPGEAWPRILAASAVGLNILSQSSTSEGNHYEMDRFDVLGHLVAQHRVAFDFRPAGMATTASGKTVVVGFHAVEGSDRDTVQYVGVVLDEDDQVIEHFDFPRSLSGATWTFGGAMTGAAGFAYVILQSGVGPTFALATVTEDGRIRIKKLRVPPNTDIRHHNEWLFGPGVAVEMYHYVGEKPRVALRFDEYDLTTGRKVATKSTLPAGTNLGCYFGNEVSMLADRAHFDPALRVPPDGPLLINTVKLE